MSGTAYVALGGNVGDCRETFERALGQLTRRRPVRLSACSSLYQTSPVGGPANQADYLNAVVQAVTELSPHQLLAALQEVEAGFRAPRRQRWGPRELDLDLLLYDQCVVHDSRLTLPHPRMVERRFVLEPFCEISPGVEHPVLKRSILSILEGLPYNGQCVNRISGAWLEQYQVHSCPKNC